MEGVSLTGTVRATKAGLAAIAAKPIAITTATITANAWRTSANANLLFLALTANSVSFIV